MRVKLVLAVSAVALMSVYALGQSHNPAPLALDPPAAAPTPSAAALPAPDLAGARVERDHAAPLALDAPAPAATPSATRSGEASIDLTALRYFVSKNDLKRAAAEIRLIRVKHPSWSPPEDLFNDSGASVDESPMWRLFEKGDYEGERAEIAARQERDPNWRPSADLVNKLTLAEAGKALTAASDAQNWDETIRIATDNKMLMTCDFVDAMWRVAEALAATQDNERALTVYKYVLTNCHKRAERIATMQKAIAIFGAGPEIDSLVALGERGNDGHNEFEFVKWDRIRALIGKASSDTSAPTPTENDVRALITKAAGGGPTARQDQTLLGWWFYSQKDYPQAEAFFRKANRGAPDSKAAEGLVMTLKAEDKLADALTLAKQYVALGAPNRAAWASVLLAQLLADDKAPLEPQDKTELLKALTEAKNADGAQALGWRFYRAGDLTQARGLFEQSLAWHDSAPAAVGLVVTTRRLADARAYAAALAKYSSAYPEVAELARIPFGRTPSRRTKVARGKGRRTHGKGGGGGWDHEADAIVAEIKAGLYPEALLRLDARRSHVRAEPAGLSVVRGWAYYNTGRYGDAEKAFRAAYDHGLKADAQKGLLKLGVTSQEP